MMQLDEPICLRQQAVNPSLGARFGHPGLQQLT